MCTPQQYALNFSTTFHACFSTIHTPTFLHTLTPTLLHTLTHSRTGVPEVNRVDSTQSIDHDHEAHNGGREEPHGVEAKPSKVDTNLLTKVASGEVHACRNNKVTRVALSYISRCMHARTRTHTHTHTHTLITGFGPGAASCTTPTQRTTGS